MSMMNKPRCIALMERTPTILRAILRDVSTEQARLATDGPDGWSVLQILCHLRDFEGFYIGRCQMMLEEDNPLLPAYDHEAIAMEQRYQEQELPVVMDQYLDKRRTFLQLLNDLTDEQLNRPGIHPENGPFTVLNQALRSVTHDIDHTEQIVRALGLAPKFV